MTTLLDRLLHGLPHLHVPDSLPCHPCPHGSPCCQHGTVLTETEAKELAYTFGPDTIDCITPWDAQFRFGNDQAWEQSAFVTTVEGGHCVHLTPEGCRAHDHPHYPAMCRAYPWQDGNHATPASDAVLCPLITSQK